MKTTILKIAIIALAIFGTSLASAKVSENNLMMVQMAPASKTIQTSFLVKGKCEQCKMRIERAAMSVKGVLHATWNQKSKILQLHYNPKQTSPIKVQQAIAKAGHDAGKIKATTAAYQALPDCCHYDRK